VNTRAVAPEGETPERKIDSNCLISRVSRCIADADQFAVSKNTVRPFPVMGLVAKTSTWKKVGLVIAGFEELRWTDALVLSNA